MLIIDVPENCSPDYLEKNKWYTLHTIGHELQHYLSSCSGNNLSADWVIINDYLRPEEIRAYSWQIASTIANSTELDRSVPPSEYAMKMISQMGLDRKTEKIYLKSIMRNLEIMGVTW